MTTAATKVATTTMSLIVEPVQPMAVADGFSLTQTVHVGIAKTIPLSVKNAAGKVTKDALRRLAV